MSIYELKKEKVKSEGLYDLSQLEAIHMRFAVLAVPTPASMRRVESSRRPLNSRNDGAAPAIVRLVHGAVRMEAVLRDRVADLRTGFSKLHRHALESRRLLLIIVDHGGIFLIPSPERRAPP